MWGKASPCYSHCSGGDADRHSDHRRLDNDHRGKGKGAEGGPGGHGGHGGHGAKKKKVPSKISSMDSVEMVPIMAAQTAAAGSGSTGFYLPQRYDYNRNVGVGGDEYDDGYA